MIPSALPSLSPLRAAWLYSRAALLLWIAVLSPRAAEAASPDKQPNVLLFLVDDMGWMDTTVYGSEYYETPNMERLAKQSLRFTQAYTANPLCSPTRASIMTGKYPARLQFTTAAGHQPPVIPFVPYPKKVSPNKPTIQPATRRFLDPSEYTLAEALKDAGYATAHIGKWHLGLNPEHWPEAQGFEVSFHGAPDPGPPSYLSPYPFKAGTVTDGPDGEYITDRVTDEAIKFIEAHAKEDGPFYLNLWHYGVHGPWGYKQEYLDYFQKKTDPTGRQTRPIMAAMLKSIDDSLGRLLDKLEELGIADDTIILFSSDNGGNTHSELGPDRQVPTNNAPLRKGKSWLYEGGIRVPLMIRWPGITQPDTATGALVSSIDFYPTLLEMTGNQPKPDQVIDGISLVPVLKGGELEREAVFNFTPHGGPTKPPGVTVHRGDWKLIRWFETSVHFPEKYELYNLANDLSETHNLATEKPELVKELDALIDGFLKDTAALVPKENPNYKPLPDDGMERWSPKFCQAEVKDGILVITPENDRAFVGKTGLSMPKRTLNFRIRVRHPGGGKLGLAWRFDSEETFDRANQLEVAMENTDGWQTVAFDLEPEKPLFHIRLRVPGEGITEIDWVDVGWVARPGQPGHPDVWKSSVWTFGTDL